MGAFNCRDFSAAECTRQRLAGKNGSQLVGGDFVLLEDIVLVLSCVAYLSVSESLRVKPTSDAQTAIRDLCIGELFIISVGLLGCFVGDANIQSNLRRYRVNESTFSRSNCICASDSASVSVLSNEAMKSKS